MHPQERAHIKAFQTIYKIQSDHKIDINKQKKNTKPNKTKRNKF